MKWLGRIFLALVGAVGIQAARNFFDKNYLLVVDKEDTGEEQVTSMDLRGTPTHVCVCGSNQFLVRTIFEDYEIATYFLDMVCVSCGSLATAPTPVDREKSE